MEPQRRLIELGTAIADGTPVDWTAAESHAAQPSEQAVVRNLRLVERIAQVHASLLSPDTVSPLLDSLLHPTAGVTAAVDGPVAWGPLTILDKIGRGTFGDVYRARDPRLDRPVALKLLRRRENDPDGLETAVIEEGRLLARVRHPNVVTVFGAERIDGRTGLWMELVEGQTLEAELRRRGPFPSADLTQVGIEVCRALGAVHQAGLLHRDLKAQNVMRDADGRVRLTDFGAGRELRDGSATASPELAGTPLYLAPEVLDGRAASPASDLYSLGVLLFHLATGSFPVRGRSLEELRDAHARATRLDLGAIRPDLPVGLIRAIDRASLADPSRRYQHAADLEAALHAALPQPSGSAWRLAIIGGGIAALIVIVALPAIWSRRAPSNSGGASSQGSTSMPGFAVQDTVNIRRLDVPSVGELSRDGRFIPVSGDSDAGSLKLMNMVAGTTRLLARDPGRQDVTIDHAIVSSDDGEVAYAWESGACRCTELRVVDAQGTGNPPRLLVHQDSPGWIAPADWSPDDHEILAWRWTRELRFQIAMVSIQDGSVRVLKSGFEDLFHMRLSPDGQYIAFDYPVAADHYARDIGVISTDGISDVPLVEAPSHDAFPMWTPDSRGVVFVSDRSGTPGLWIAPVLAGRPHGSPEILRKDMGRVRPHVITQNGTLFYELQSGAVDVYTAGFGPDGTIRADSIAQAGSSYLGSNMDPDWAPDGRSLVYISRRRSMGPVADALVTWSLDSRHERAVWPDLSGFIEPRWSPDGRSVVVRGGDRHGVGGSWLVDVRTGSIRTSLGPLTSIEWAPDGRSLFAIESLRQVQQVDPMSGRAREIFHDQGGATIFGLAVSPDGTSLAVSLNDPGGTRVAILPSSGGTPREIVRFADPKQFTHLQQWTRAGDNVLFTRRVETPPIHDELWSVSAAGGAPRSLNLVRDRIEYVRVSPDGTRIAFRTGRPFWDLWLMDNVLSRTPGDRR